jgi:histidinol phosphatase-like enzyme
MGFPQGFSKWQSLKNIADLPKTQIIYVIRAVDNDKMPIHINRARANDCDGILNIGSGKGKSRIKKLNKSFTELTSTKQWNQWKHHQLVLWCLKFDFATLLGLTTVKVDNIEFCWIHAPDSKSARKKEKEMIINYKNIYADIPIGNLKSW